MQHINVASCDCVCHGILHDDGTIGGVVSTYISAVVEDACRPDVELPAVLWQSKLSECAVPFSSLEVQGPNSQGPYREVISLKSCEVVVQPSHRLEDFSK